MHKPIEFTIERRSCGIAACLMPMDSPLLACAKMPRDILRSPFKAGVDVDVASLAPRRIPLLAVGAISREWMLSDGRRQVLDFLFRGDLVPPPVDNQAIRYVALSEGILYLVDSAALDRYRSAQHDCNGVDRGNEKDAPSITLDDGNWRASLTHQRLSEVTAQNLLLSQMTALERIAVFLRHLIPRIGILNGNGIQLPSPMTREHIADHLGIKPETVSRQFSQLRRRGVIQLPKPGLVQIMSIVGLGEISPLPANVS